MSSSGISSDESASLFVVGADSDLIVLMTSYAKCFCSCHISVSDVA